MVKYLQLVRNFKKLFKINKHKVDTKRNKNPIHSTRPTPIKWVPFFANEYAEKNNIPFAFLNLETGEFWEAYVRD